MSSSKTSLAGLESRSARTRKSGIRRSPQLFVADRLQIHDYLTRLLFSATDLSAQIFLVLRSGGPRLMGRPWPLRPLLALSTLALGFFADSFGKRRVIRLRRSSHHPRLVAVLRWLKRLLRLSQLMPSILITRRLEAADGLFFHRMIGGCRELCFVGSFRPMIGGRLTT